MKRTKPSPDQMKTLRQRRDYLTRRIFGKKDMQTSEDGEPYDTRYDEREQEATAAAVKYIEDDE